MLTLVAAGCASLAVAMRIPPLARPAAGLLGGALGIACILSLPPSPFVDGRVGVSGVVIGAPVGGVADVFAQRIRAPATGTTQGGRIRVRFTGKAPPPGTEVMLTGTAGAPSSQALPDAPDVAWGGQIARIRTEVRAHRWHRVGSPPARPLPPGRHGGVLHALAWGDRTHLDPALVERMRRTGTAHLLAISGFHVGLVAGAVGGSLRALIRVLAALVPTGLPTGWVWLVGAVCAWIYAELAGAPIGALRSAWVLTGIAALSCLGLRVRGLDLLLVAGAAIAIADPAASTTPGFHLSFGAVLGLLRFTPQLEAVRPRRWPRRLNAVWTSVSASCAATIGTLPASGWWFQTFAWTSPAGNLVAGPIVSLLLVPLAALHAAAPELVDGWVGPLTDVVCHSLIALLWGVDFPPWPIALGPAGALSLAAALIIHRRWAWLIAFVICTAPGRSPPASGVRVTAPAVGHGAAALVEWSDGRTWLIDGGPRRDAILQWLRRRGVRELDVIVASSGRASRAAGLAAVVEHLPVGEVWIPPNSRGDPDLRDLVTTAVARRVPVIPDPPANIASEARALLRDEGDRSLVLEIGPDTGPGMLFTGDLGRRGASEVARAVDEIAVLQIPRLGTQTSGGPRPWGPLDPPFLLVPGRASPQILSVWADRGARAWEIERDGTVEMTLRSGRIDVRTWTWTDGWRRGPTLHPSGTPWTRAGEQVYSLEAPLADRVR